MSENNFHFLFQRIKIIGPFRNASYIVFQDNGRSINDLQEKITDERWLNVAAWKLYTLIFYSEVQLLYKTKIGIKGKPGSP